MEPLPNLDNTPTIATITLNPAIDHTLSIPRFTAGAVNRVERSRFDAGGKGVNVAAALADNGFSVAVTGFLGRENDEPFRRLFTSKHITDHFVRIGGMTRTGIKVIDPILHQTTDINFPGEPPPSADIDALFQAVAMLAQGCDWFIISGSVPASLSPAIYHELVQMLKAHGKWVAIDTSGEPLRQALAAGPNVVKPNVIELRELLGEPLADVTTVLAAARQIAHAYGISCMAVSMGQQGALCVEGEETVLAVPASVPVVSTVGAGDAFVAGLVAGTVRGLSLADRARMATAFAMGVIGQLGAGLPPDTEITRLMRQVSIRTPGPPYPASNQNQAPVSLSSQVEQLEERP